MQQFIYNAKVIVLVLKKYKINTLYLKNSKTIYHVWFIIDKAKLLRAIRNQCFFNLFGHALGFQEELPDQGSSPQPLQWKCSLNRWNVRDVLDICLRVLPAFTASPAVCENSQFFLPVTMGLITGGRTKDHKWSNWAYVLQLLTCRPAQCDEGPACCDQGQPNR